MKPIPVSALNTHIVAIFERDELLRDIWVLGEVSNWKRAASGHVYFSLKDDGAAIGAVMWKNLALSQSWLPKEGDQIVAHGYVGVYPERGQYQLYVNQILPAGRGQLYDQVEQIKARLNAAGLFDPARKRAIVTTPRRLGIITSRDAAALRDVLRVLAGRWPLVEVLLFPSLVQGADAPAQLVAALANAAHYSATVAPLDTLLLVRGGGAIEDLWAFNDEMVARAVADSPIPVISGVGHETDTTVVDFVADLRAPTPSAAAAAATPDRNEMLERVRTLQQRLAQGLVAHLADERSMVEQVERRLQRLAPQRQLDLRRQRLEERAIRLHFRVQRQLDRLAQRTAALRLQLAALNPHAVLQRGYSIVRREDGEVVTSPAMSTPGQVLHVRAAGGEYDVIRSEAAVTQR